MHRHRFHGLYFTRPRTSFNITNAAAYWKAVTQSQKLCFTGERKTLVCLVDEKHVDVWLHAWFRHMRRSFFQFILDPEHRHLESFGLNISWLGVICRWIYDVCFSAGLINWNIGTLLQHLQ